MAKAPKTLGERIRVLREAKGMSGRGLAIKAGLSQSYLWQIENQPEHDPKLSTIVAIAEVLGVSISELVPSPK